MNKTIIASLLAATLAAPLAYAAPAVDGEIQTLDDLRWLSETPSAWTRDWVLKADIDASATSTWNVGDHDGDAGTPDEPMGFLPIALDSVFEGGFDGGGHTISNLYFNRPRTIDVALFSTVMGSSSTFKNLILENPVVIGQANVAALIAVTDRSRPTDLLTLTDISVINADIKASSSGVGSLVGRGGIRMVAERISVKSKIESNGEVGGVFGDAYGGVDLDDASVNVVIVNHGFDSVGGLAGVLAGGTSTLSNIKDFVSDITVTKSQASGGVIGTARDSVVVRNFTGNTTVSTQSTQDQVAGFIGFSLELELTNVHLNTVIDAPNVSIVGGIAAYVNGTSGFEHTLTDVTVIADINGYDAVGGVVGVFYSIPFNLTNVNLTATVKGRGEGVGGVVGAGYSNVNLTDSSIDTNVSMTEATERRTGGVIGVQYADSSWSSSYIKTVVNSEGSSAGGMFGYVPYATTMNDLTLDTTVNAKGVIVGGISADTPAASTLSGFTLNTSVTGASMVGGVIGRSYSAKNISNSKVDATVSSSGDFAGGVAGSLTGGVTLNNLDLVSSVDANNSVGGAIGIIEGGSTISGVHVTSKVKGADRTGGVIGSADIDPASAAVTLSNVLVDSMIEGANYVGAVVGESGHLNLSNVEIAESTDIQGTAFVGAISGSHVSAKEGSRLEHVAALAKITSQSDVGGLFGASAGVTLDSVISNGDVNTSTEGVESASALIGSVSDSDVINTYYSIGAMGYTDALGVQTTKEQLKSHAFLNTWSFASPWVDGDWFTVEDGYPNVVGGSAPAFILEESTPTTFDIENGASVQIDMAAANTRVGFGDVSYELTDAAPDFVTVDANGLVSVNPVATKDVGEYKFNVVAKSELARNSSPTITVRVKGNDEVGEPIQPIPKSGGSMGGMILISLLGLAYLRKRTA